MQRVPTHLTDEALIELINAGGGNQLFKFLYDRYYDKVTNKCYSFVKNKTQAREMAKDIFARVFEKLSGFKNKSTFSSWIFAVTYNHCIDYLRENKTLHYPRWNEQNEIPEIIEESESQVPDINYENLEIILELIHPEEKALLLMKYQDNLSLKQISESLRISENAAKMRLKRARTRVVYLYTQKFLTEE